MNIASAKKKVEKANRNSKMSRLWPIFLNGLKTFITPAISILFSYLVIQFSSKTIWGEFVPFLLYFHLANIITNWGSKDYLLRSFSSEPGKKKEDWQAFFITRLPVIALSMVICLLFFEVKHALYLAGWLFMAYISNSVIPMINDQRDYARVVIIEIISFLALIGICFWPGTMINLNQLLVSFLLYQAIRALLFQIRYFSFFRFGNPLTIGSKFKLGLLIAGLPFFLLALAGFAQSKFDLYIFKIFANEVELANYQIISGFLIFSQALATIILMPYVRNIYRMRKRTLIKIARFMTLIGIPVQLLGTAAIYIVLRFLFDIELNLLQVSLCFLIGYPSFAYAVHVFSGFAQKKEKQVLWVSFISALLNGILSWVFLSLEMSITGVLIAHASAQVITMLGYRSIKLNDYSTKENK